MEAFDVNTIRKVHRYLYENGCCISEYALRRWVKLGLIPATYSGRTAYISVSSVKTLLRSGVLSNSAS